ncbi:hypothetical protein I7I48_07426 [Histoplasma ohiense]|nr:hypothetical protein I7I48_07426 [Histoplasma ohiense (nom. inval.)]
MNQMDIMPMQLVKRNFGSGPKAGYSTFSNPEAFCWRISIIPFGFSFSFLFDNLLLYKFLQYFTISTFMTKYRTSGTYS